MIISIANWSNSSGGLANRHQLLSSELFMSQLLFRGKKEEEEDALQVALIDSCNLKIWRPGPEQLHKSQCNDKLRETLVAVT